MFQSGIGDLGALTQNETMKNNLNRFNVVFCSSKIAQLHVLNMKLSLLFVWAIRKKLWVENIFIIFILKNNISDFSSHLLKSHYATLVLIEVISTCRIRSASLSELISFITISNGLKNPWLISDIWSENIWKT